MQELEGSSQKWEVSQNLEPEVAQELPGYMGVPP